MLEMGLPQPRNSDQAFGIEVTEGDVREGSSRDGSEESQAGPTQEFFDEKGVCEMLKTFRPAKVPEYYIKPPDQRGSLAVDPQAHAQGVDQVAVEVPVVDLGAPRDEVLRQIADACEWGFFQIVNHGTPADLLANIAREAQEFFSLPIEEKTRCSTSAKVKGPVHFGGGSKGDWRDVLKLQCAPASAVLEDYWPHRPYGFRETIKLYCHQQLGLSMRLLEMIDESLGLKKGYIEDICQEPRVLLAFNHYPPCPDPSLTIGIREHSDPNTITLLLQDPVQGLQVYKDDHWIDVKPLPNALVVNVGDHLQILSNGRYKSCLHRVVTNKSSSRTSIAMFLSPSLAAHVGPASSLVDGEHPPVYHDFLYGDFLKDFYLKGGPNKKTIMAQFQKLN